MTTPEETDGQGAGTRYSSFDVLAEHEPGRRNRRTIDVAFLFAAAVVIGLTAVAASSAEAEDAQVQVALTAVLGWAESFWRLVFFTVLVFAATVVLNVLVRRRWTLARDLVVALLVVACLSITLDGVVEDDWIPFEAHLLADWGFPDSRLAAAVAIFVVAGPELVHWVRQATIWTAPAAAVGAIVLGVALPAAALGALAVGLGAGVLVRLAFGSAAGMPPSVEVRANLAALGVDVRDLKPAVRQRVGYAEYVGRDRDGLPLKARVLGRDAQDTQRLARRWRLLAYRDPPRSAPVGRLEQVEHEGLALFMAGQAGVRVPEVVIAALDARGNAVLVTRQPDVGPLESVHSDAVSDAALLDLLHQVAGLHAAGISHGRLNLSNVLPTDDGPMLVDLSAATLGAPQSSLDIDVAELLVACCVLVGPERALTKAVEAGWGDAVARVLPYVQRAALTPHLRDLAHDHEVGVTQLRKAAAEAAGTEPPEIAPLRRVRAKDVVLMAALVFAAYLIISQLAEIGFGTIADELREADLAWVVIALVLAQATFIASGISVRGAVATPLPLLPCIVLQSAIKFVNLTVPSSAGRIGMNLRFLQRMGVPRAEALTAGAVDDASETIVQAGLFLATLAFVNVSLDTGAFSSAGPDRRLVIGIGIALAVSAILVLASPRMRRRVLPGIKSGLSSLWSVARVRRKRVELFGGNVGSEGLYALSLGATCLAYGAHLSLAELVFVNTAAAVLSGLIPVPGGIGAAEASLSAGLIAVGVDESTAFAIAITQRLSTFYLPPVWGYFSLRWLSRKGYV